MRGAESRQPVPDLSTGQPTPNSALVRMPSAALLLQLRYRPSCSGCVLLFGFNSGGTAPTIRASSPKPAENAANFLNRQRRLIEIEINNVVIAIHLVAKASAPPPVHDRGRGFYPRCGLLRRKPQFRA